MECEDYVITYCSYIANCCLASGFSLSIIIIIMCEIVLRHIYAMLLVYKNSFSIKRDLGVASKKA